MLGFSLCQATTGINQISTHTIDGLKNDSQEDRDRFES